MLNEQFQKDLLNTTLNVQEAKLKSHCELTGTVYFATKFILHESFYWARPHY